MLKSLFSKPKTEELLPPPPPFPSMDLEEGHEPVSSQFQELFKDVESPAIDVSKPETKIMPEVPGKNPKKAGKSLGKAEKQKKTAKKIESKDEIFNLDKEFGLDIKKERKPEELDLGISDADFEEDLEIDDSGAEQEIEEAINDAKNPAKRSFLGSLFAKKASKTIVEPKPGPIADNLDAIKSRLAHARNALMDLDLKEAKWDYIEIMRMYNSLKPEEQAKVYAEIKDLYYERKNAEELKI